MSTSIGNMIKRISGLLGTEDLSEWETEFVESVVERSQDGATTVLLTEKQITKIEQIFNKYFAG